MQERRSLSAAPLLWQAFRILPPKISHRSVQQCEPIFFSFVRFLLLLLLFFFVFTFSSVRAAVVQSARGWTILPIYLFAYTNTNQSRQRVCARSALIRLLILPYSHTAWYVRRGRDYVHCVIACLPACLPHTHSLSLPFAHSCRLCLAVDSTSPTSLSTETLGCMRICERAQYEIQSRTK